MLQQRNSDSIHYPQLTTLIEDMLREALSTNIYTPRGIFKYVDSHFVFMINLQYRASRSMHTLKKYALSIYQALPFLPEEDVKSLLPPEKYSVKNILVSPRALSTVIFDISCRLKDMQNAGKDGAVIKIPQSDVGILIEDIKSESENDSDTETESWSITFGSDDNPSTSSNTPEFLLFCLIASTYNELVTLFNFYILV